MAKPSSTIMEFLALNSKFIEALSIFVIMVLNTFILLSVFRIKRHFLAENHEFDFFLLP